ncbi:S4 domain-containing protein [Henriciella mobilis]|uniref:RNA-binding S4 domain-containing protein n=1 Tax=Henriciella mobilis TaxID=2305467 RepID=A0A399RLA8_9PROT|nr:S4 domain-containing protein [Henriciella mobilis]RIJ30589.1 RNA-binding S4 domain-containing protein [Henriciella mobilis]
MSEDVRLDVWLWRARFFKTRSLSSGFISRRGVRVTRDGVTRKLNKPASRLSVGDVVSLPLGAQIVELRVVDFGTRRGPASEAQQLYERLEARDTGEG